MLLNNYLLILLGTMVDWNKAEDYEEVKFDIEVYGRAFDAVCWFEFLKSSPPASVREKAKQKWFGNGLENCKERQGYFKYFPRMYENNPSELRTRFENGLDSTIYWRLPEDYHANCNPSKPDAKWEPDADESDIIGDGGKNVPHRWLATCLLRTLKQRHGDKAMEIVKLEKASIQKTQPADNWREVMLEKENHYRELHGASPLKLDEELNAAAEEYAEFLISPYGNGCRRCPCAIKGRCHKDGKRMGENLCFGDGTDFSLMPYVCPAFYYSQKPDYPLPAPEKGRTTKWSFETGSFEQYAQMLWNSTEFVGYGYAGYDGDDQCGTYFLVARYFPIGGKIDFEKEEFLKNVFPLKE